MSGCDSGSQPPVDQQASVPAVRNLVVICLDTVRADVFFRLGEARGDALSERAQDALVYTQAISPSPWTVPTIGSVFSGLWPIQHGGGHIEKQVKEFADFRPRVMHDDTPSLVETAGAQGFDSVVVSSSGWTMARKHSLGIVRGFETFHAFSPDSIEGLGDAYWQPMLEKWRQVLVGRQPDQRSIDFLHFMEAHNWHLVDEEQLDSRIADVAADQLTLYKSLAPEYACEDEQSMYCKRFLVYMLAVSELRDAMAEFLDTLDAEGLLNDTAVVLFSDHGEEFADHMDDGRELRETGENYFGHGHTLYQELIHVPLLVWHPGYEGRVIDYPVSLVDVAPSAGRWLQLDYLPEQWGGAFLDDFKAPSGTPADRVIYASNTISGERRMSALQNVHKSIWYRDSDRTEYFDLSRDPLERQPIPGEKLALRFDGYFVDYVQAQPAEVSEELAVSKEQLQRLQAIGYMQGVEATGE